jgi:hypothetical protein
VARTQADEEGEKMAGLIRSWLARRAADAALVSMESPVPKAPSMGTH